MKIYDWNPDVGSATPNLTIQSKSRNKMWRFFFLICYGISMCVSAEREKNSHKIRKSIVSRIYGCSTSIYMLHEHKQLFFLLVNILNFKNIYHLHNIIIKKICELSIKTSDGIYSKRSRLNARISSFIQPKHFSMNHHSRPLPHW